MIRLKQVYPLIKISGLIIKAIDFITPKDNRLIICGSNGGKFASGSPKAIAAHIQQFVPEIGIQYYLPFRKTLKGVSKVLYIFKFAPLFFRARYLISSHPPNDFFPFSNWSKRKILINTWHGIPLKAMFYSDKNASINYLKVLSKVNIRTNALIVSSKLEEALLAKCFLINPRKYYRSGHPRNDNLVNNINQKNLEKMKWLPDYEKVVLYCPTYRRNERTRLFPFLDMDFIELNKLLNDMNAIILIRRHYNEQHEDAKVISDRIRLFGFDVCNDISSILPEVDVLLTDYSSIYIDFMILDRPMIFIPYDLEEYKKNTGLLLDDYDYWTPGPKVHSLSELKVALINSLLGEDDSYSARRKELAKQFHSYDNGDSCERVVNLIKGKAAGFL